MDQKKLAKLVESISAVPISDTNEKQRVHVILKSWPDKVTTRNTATVYDELRKLEKTNKEVKPVIEKWISRMKMALTVVLKLLLLIPVLVTAFSRRCSRAA